MTNYRKELLVYGVDDVAMHRRIIKERLRTIGLNYEGFPNWLNLRHRLESAVRGDDPWPDMLAIDRNLDGGEGGKGFDVQLPMKGEQVVRLARAYIERVQKPTPLLYILSDDCDLDLVQSVGADGYIPKSLIMSRQSLDQLKMDISLKHIGHLAKRIKTRRITRQAD